MLRLILLPALLWSWLFWHLHYTWELDDQYRYGWAVPFLVALLLYSRWRDRPPSAPARHRASVILRIVLLASLLPLRVIQEANPDWRLLSWLFGLIVVFYTLDLFLRLGGSAWLRHFAFPICFALVAVPWLVQFEVFVVQALTGAVAAVAVEIAGWLGLGAYQLGNVIQLRNGFVGVDEACSGVRTLQTAIMVSLFLGELSRLAIGRRVLLVAISCSWVFLCNVARAAALVSIAGTRGFAVLHQAHDTVGTVAMIVGLAGILMTAFLLRDDKAEVATGGAIPVRVPAVGVAQMIAGIAWLVVVFGATELWYRSQEHNLIARAAWQPVWPEDARPLPIGDPTRAILRYNNATSAAWRASSGEWWAFYARWKPHRTAAQLVRSHSPDICLPAIGRDFEGELDPVRIDAAGTSLAFRLYQFAQNGKPLFVFLCIQEDKTPKNGTTTAEWSTRGRLEAAWNGRRNLGQRLLELALIGANSSDDAERAAVQLVPTIVRPAITD